MSKYVVVILAALFAAGLVSAAEVHRWVDEQGKVHYGEHPPPGAKAALVKVDPPSTNVAADKQATEVNQDVPVGSEVDADALVAEEKSLKSRRCQAARDLMKKYDEARFMVVKDAEGKETRAPLEQEAAERLRVRREIEQNCGG